METIDEATDSYFSKTVWIQYVGLGIVVSHTLLGIRHIISSLCAGFAYSSRSLDIRVTFIIVDILPYVLIVLIALLFRKRLMQLFTKSKLKRIIVISIVVYIIIQVLLYLLTVYLFDLFPETYLDGWDEHREFTSKHSILAYTKPTMLLMSIVAVMYIFLLKPKKEKF